MTAHRGNAGVTPALEIGEIGAWANTLTKLVGKRPAAGVEFHAR